MTAINTHLQRLTHGFYRNRPLVVDLHPRHLAIRLLRGRMALTVDYQTIYELAMKLQLRREQADKPKKLGRKR